MYYYVNIICSKPSKSAIRIFLKPNLRYKLHSSKYSKNTFEGFFSCCFKTLNNAFSPCKPIAVKIESNLNKFRSPSVISSSSIKRHKLSSTKKLASCTKELNIFFKSVSSKSEEVEERATSDLSDRCLDLELAPKVPKMIQTTEFTSRTDLFDMVTF